MDAFSWLVALTLRCTVVLSVALGLGLLLRRSSAVARHRLLTAHGREPARTTCVAVEAAEPRAAARASQSRAVQPRAARGLGYARRDHGGPGRGVRPVPLEMKGAEDVPDGFYTSSPMFVIGTDW